MIKIIIASDSHGDTHLLQQIANANPKVDWYLHAGDSEDTADAIFPFISVKGNCDYLINDKERIIKVNDYFTIYMCHGHAMFLSKQSIRKQAKKVGCNIFIHGHTHKPYIDYDDDLITICPGSINYPRSSMGKTYVVLDINEDKLQAEIIKIKEE